MNKIDFPRLGVDVVIRSQKDIEDWYLKDSTGIYKKIKKDLEKEKNKRYNQNVTRQDLFTFLNDNLKDFLIAPPSKLENYRRVILAKYDKILYYVRYTKKRHIKQVKNTKLCNKLLDIYNYQTFREKVLVELSKMLNIKTCPYCNQNYTLYITLDDKTAKAEFEFDHFFEKSKYPFFSMSLYNLIPACSNCNHRKQSKDEPIELNPYYQNTYNLFKFHIKDSSLLASGAFSPDKIAIEIIPATQSYGIEDFLKELHIVQQYERHRDIVQEIYDKVYSMIYYDYNGLWNSGVLPSLQEADRKYLLDLWVGVPMDKAKIDTKPLTKFIQDIWEQATKEYHINL